MKQELELFKFDAAQKKYLAAVKKIFSAWGISGQFAGSFNSGVADELNLSLPGAALSDTDFTPRSRIILSLSGKPFFSGYVMDDPARDGDGGSSSATLAIAGPWWFLENLTFQQERRTITGFDDDRQPIFETKLLMQYTLNLQLTQTYTPPTDDFGPGVIDHAPTLLDSRAQIIAVLDYAKANGAWLDYDPADILSVPVLPADVMQINCAEAIRRQLEDVDAVVWFDHTVNPPRLHAQRAKDLPAYLKKLGDNYQAQGFKGLKRNRALDVPYVQLNFQQPYNVGDIQQVFETPIVYPDPKPADNFKALITVVPLRSISATVHEKYIKTEKIEPDTLAWWKRRKPETDETLNANAPIEYADLQLVDGTTKRNGNLQNMIVDGGYADFMGGTVVEENIFVQAKYHRRWSEKQSGSRIAKHTWRAHCRTTNLNFPNGALLRYTDFSSSGEDTAGFEAMPRIIYEDLNRPSWSGTIPLIEEEFSGDIVLGKLLNLGNGRAEWETMAALQQSIGFSVKPGCIAYSVTLGVNKKLTVGQLIQRLRFARARYIVAGNYSTAQPTANVKMTRHNPLHTVSDAHPVNAEQTVIEAQADSDFLGLVSMTGNAGSPKIVLQKVDLNGDALTPTTPGNPSGRLILEHAKLKGSDGNWHDVNFVEVKVCKDGKQRTILLPGSDIFKAPDDPD